MNNKKLLESMTDTVQMGQIGIRSVLDTPVALPLRNALASQLREYDLLETQSHEIASGRGWELKEVNPAVRKMANATVKLRLSHGDTQSKIAAMMIRGNTRGMILGLRNLHKCENPDSQIKDFWQKVQDCEEANIRQMQRFL